MTASTDHEIPDRFRGPGKTPEQLRWLRDLNWDSVRRALDTPRTHTPRSERTP